MTDQEGDAMDQESPGITNLLNSVNGGRDGAFAELVEAVYDDLRRLAASRMRGRFDRPLEALTVQPTALANEAIMELRRQRAEWQNTEQFFAIAVRLISRITLQYQRDRLAQKRGGGNRGGAIQESASPSDEGALDALESPSLAALEKLHEEYPRKAEILALNVLCGHPMPRAAELVGISLAQAERDKRFAVAWIRDHLSSD